MNPKRLGFQAIDLHFGMFDFDVHVIVGNKRENVQRYVEWKIGQPFDVPWEGERRLGAFFSAPHCVPVIWLPRKPRTTGEIGTLAHEMLHAVRMMLVDWAGVELNRDTDEAFCHAIGYGVRTVLEKVR